MTEVVAVRPARRGPDPRILVTAAGTSLAGASLALSPLSADPGPARGVLTRLALGLLAAGLVTVGVRAARASARPPVRRALVIGLAAVGPLVLWFGTATDARVRAALVSVLVAVGASGALFLAANRWFDLAVPAWPRFSAISGAVLVGGLAAVLVGNRQLGLLVGSGAARRDLSVVLVPVLALLGALLGWVSARTDDGRRRLLVGPIGGLALGVAVGAFLRPAAWPTVRPVALVAGPLIGLALGLAVATVRRRPRARTAVLGALAGWVVGAWLVPPVGVGGTVGAAMVGSAVTGLGAGAWIGLGSPPDFAARIHLERRARVAVFVGPALTFIAATLLVPTIRTIGLSLRGRRSVEFVGLANYRTIFRDPNFIALGGWPSIVSRGGFVAALVLVVAGLVVLLRSRRATDGVTPRPLVVATPIAAIALAATLAVRRPGDVAATDPRLAAVLLAATVLVGLLLVRYVTADRGHSGFLGAGGAAIGGGVFVLAFAVFASLRGTLFNNLWWVFTVTIASTGLGLAIAAIADRSRAESVAKSIIFMPMAISFVGAGIIWRFMFIARPPGDPQTGVLNAAWVGLGRLSTGPWRLPIGIALLVLVGALVLLAVRAARLGIGSVVGGSVTVALPSLWLGTRFLGPGVGGAERLADGAVQDRILLFLQTLPYNNVWMMVPFTWIYTGFAMVILSAAIKAVPSDLLEAGRVDGASESQLFWRVVVPEIAPTIGVVVTTIIVVVTKVFDIVKVMTNGSFGTQVLANDMWARSFAQGDFGQGSAIAVMLFLSVLPVMYVNVRRMQREAR